MQTRDRLKRLMKQVVAAYDKHVKFTDYQIGYLDAVRRATRMWKDAEEAGEGWQRNPVTTAHLLAIAIGGEAPSFCQ